MSNPSPIIHIIGLPGAGKTTLSIKLSKRLELPVMGIGRYRARFPKTPLGEADAWVRLYMDLSRRKWGDCILETTGMNAREHFLYNALPLTQRVVIKLEAKRNILYQRIAKKRKVERGDPNWSFGHQYPDKFVFVRKMFAHFKQVPATIRIETSEMTAREVFRKVLKELDSYLDFD